MKWINYHHLIYFKVIANQGSISKASKILNVGQPALSAQLKKLEEYLHVKLFDRKNRKLILTDAGKTALDYAEKISELGQELINVLENKTYTKTVNLNVGAIDAIPKHIVSSILDFVHKETGCFLTILEGEPDQLTRELINHKLDVVLADQILTSSESNIFTKRILKVPINAYATKDYERVKKGFPQSLNGEKCILPTFHSKLRSDLDHYFHMNKIFVSCIAQTQDTMLQKILACKGDGIIFLPEVAAREYVKDKKLIQLGSLEHIYVEYFLTYSKKMIENPAVEVLSMQDFSNLEIF
jgi:LysR family transcriptional activator of nhaA